MCDNLKLDVCNETPSAHGGEGGVLQHVVKNVLPQCTLNQSDVFNVSAAEPLCPVSSCTVGEVLCSTSDGSSTSTDWDGMARRILS